MTFSKPLWMTVANERCEDIAHTVHDLLSSHPCTSIALVDVSQTRHTIWPLMKSLMGTSPEYRQEIENEPPRPFCIYFSKRPWVGGFYFTERPIWGGRFKPEPWEEANAYIDENIGVRSSSPVHSLRTNFTQKTVIKRMIFTPMEHIKKKTAHRRAQMAPVVLIITGVQNIAQADELYRLIEVLNGLEVIRIVVITGPNLFRHVSARNEDLLQRAHTLYVSNGPNGPIVYSGKDYVPPTFDAVCLVSRTRFMALLTRIRIFSQCWWSVCTGSVGPSSRSTSTLLHKLLFLTWISQGVEPSDRSGNFVRVSGSTRIQK
jgi:hypothetical protein